MKQNLLILDITISKVPKAFFSFTHQLYNNSNSDISTGNTGISIFDKFMSQKSKRIVSTFMMQEKIYSWTHF